MKDYWEDEDVNYPVSVVEMARLQLMAQVTLCGKRDLKCCGAWKMLLGKAVQFPLLERLRIAQTIDMS